MSPVSFHLTGEGKERVIPSDKRDPYLAVYIFRLFHGNMAVSVAVLLSYDIRRPFAWTQRPL